MTEQTNYYIKELDYTGAPKWAVYERTEEGSHVICLCYDESTAQRMARLLSAEAPLPAGLDDTGAI